MQDTNAFEKDEPASTPKHTSMRMQVTSLMRHHIKNAENEVDMLLKTCPALGLINTRHAVMMSHLYVHEQKSGGV